MENKGIKVVAQQSHEDYLEAILMVSKEKENVRAVDLANALNFSRASVAIALKKLKEEKMIRIDDSNFIHLTKKGMDIAKNVFYRHEILTKFLIKIGVNSDTAESDACTIEHVISQETFEAIEKEFKKHE